SSLGSCSRGIVPSASNSLYRSGASPNCKPERAPCLGNRAKCAWHVFSRLLGSNPRYSLLCAGSLPFGALSGGLRSWERPAGATANTTTHRRPRNTQAARRITNPLLRGRTEQLSCGGPPARRPLRAEPNGRAAVSFSVLFGTGCPPCSPLEVRGVQIPRHLRDVGQLTAIIYPDLGLDRGLQLAAHLRNEVFVLFPVRSEVDHLRGIGLKIEELHIVCLVELVGRLRAVPIDRGKVARELITAIEHGPDAAALLQVGLVASRLHRLLGVLALRDRLTGHLDQAAVIGHEGAVGEENGLMGGVDPGRL